MCRSQTYLRRLVSNFLSAFDGDNVTAGSLASFLIKLVFASYCTRPDTAFDLPATGSLLDKRSIVS